MYKNSYNNRRNDRPRNENIEFPLIDTFRSRSDQELDANQIYGILKDLNEDGVFGTISVYVQIPRSILMNDPEKKGFMNVGFIREVDVDRRVVDVTVYGNQVESVKNIMADKTVFLVPKIISDRNGDFSTFTNFNLEVQ